MTDFPAAHSMDTDWFAIDADGNIGVFQSGEGGAVPISNRELKQKTTIENIEDLFALMSKDYQDGFIPLKTSGDIISKSLSIKKIQSKIDSLLSFRSTYNHSHTVKTPDPLEEFGYDCLLLLSCESDIHKLSTCDINNAFGLRFTEEKVVVFVSHYRIAVLQNLIDEGKILGGRESSVFDFVGLLGFFNYVCGEHSSFPYKLVGKPTNPLMLMDIPAHIRELIEVNKFNGLSFREKRTLQPIEHTKCDGYGSWWVDEQGKQHNQHPTY
jgi:hypothetical protein